MRCPAVLPNGTAVANGTRYVLKSGRGPIQASPDCTTATCRPVLQDMAVLELITASPVRAACSCLAVLTRAHGSAPCSPYPAEFACETWRGMPLRSDKCSTCCHVDRLTGARVCMWVMRACGHCSLKATLLDSRIRGAQD